MKRIHCVICGLVQGCGFRDFCWKCARKTGVTGWAANDESCMKRVYLEVQGSEEHIEMFLALLKKGNGHCRVDTIERSEVDAVPGEKGFRATRYRGYNS